MVGKQCWRLIPNPNSLWAQVLKGKYFPKCSLLDARVGYGVSFLWQGFMKALQLIKEGMCWKVGNGRSINIWRDNWIPSLNHKKPLMFNDNLPSQMVSCLIDEQGTSWKRDLVKSSFLQEEAKAILSIPLSFRLPADELFWPENSDGRYSVRSGYILAEKLRRNALDIPTCSKKDEGFWKSVWRLKLPLKVIHFLWKLCNKTLPCFKALKSKGVEADLICPRCKGVEESLMHIFQLCPASKQIWKRCNFSFRLDKIISSDPYEWISAVKRKLTSDDFNYFVVLLWWIWSERNGIVHGKSPSNADMILNLASQWFTNWKSIQNASNSLFQPSKGHDGSVLKHWVPPDKSCFKVNIDASWKSIGAPSGAGFVVRDAEGEVLLAAAVPIQPSESAFLVELRALIAALDVVADACFYNVVIESDCLLLVQSLRAKVCAVAANSLLFEDALIRSHRFRSISYNHVSRECNELAHSLAQWAISLSFPIIMLEDFPVFVSDIVQRDKISIV